MYPQIELNIALSLLCSLQEQKILSLPSFLIFGSTRFFEFTTIVDTTAQEGIESFTLHLSATSLPPGVILQDTLTVNIKDTTREYAARIT